jgi:hypothetical protein
MSIVAHVYMVIYVEISNHDSHGESMAPPYKPKGNDLNIMEFFISQKIPPKQLIRLNRCRLFLQLLSLSDLLSADGKLIMSSALEGKPLIDRRSTLTWPEQGNPSRSDWKLWASALQTLHSNYVLLQPIMHSGLQHQPWFWYLDKNKSLFHCTDHTSWVVCPPSYPQRSLTRSHYLCYKKALLTPCTQPPPPLHTTSVQEYPRGILQAIPDYSMSIRPGPPQLDPIQVTSQSTPTYPSHHPFYLHLLSSLTLDDEQSMAIVSSIQQGTLVACCDGSFDPITRKAAFGLVLADSGAKVHLLKLYGPSTGHSNARSAIRAELCGISASIYLLLYTLSRLGAKGGTITLYNDCAKALKYINQPGRKFKRFLIDDYDLLSEIRTTTQALRQLVTVNLLWVKGHYSRKNREPQHDLNAEAHSLATTALPLVSQSSIDISPPLHLWLILNWSIP